jgi:hypothetical protein
MEQGVSVQQTRDRGFIFSGMTMSYTSSFNAWIVKTDYNGEELWNKTFDGLYLSHVQQTEDDGFIAGGRKYSDNFETSDILVIKTNVNGDIEWEKNIGGPNLDGCLWIEQTFNNGFILTGQSENDISKDHDISLIKLDRDGNVEWSKYYGGLFFDTGNCVIQTDDGGYIVAGGTSVDAGDVMDAFLLKTDSMGEVEWYSTFGGIGDDEFNEIHETEEGGLIAIGSTNSYVYGAKDIWVVEFSFVDNSIPLTPSSPTGPDAGKVNEEYTFVSSTTDLDGDEIYYMFDWGDGSFSNWLGPFVSNEECSSTHIWEQQGNYQIRVKAKDIHGAESEWSEPLIVSMPKNRDLTNVLLFNLYRSFTNVYMRLILTVFGAIK